MSLDGTWNVTLKTPMGERSGSLRLSTGDGGLSGTWEGPQGRQEFSGGTVSGSEFSWTNSVSGPMGQMQIQWNGELSADDVIQGSVQFGSFGGGDFTGTRAT